MIKGRLPNQRSHDQKSHAQRPHDQRSTDQEIEIRWRKSNKQSKSPDGTGGSPKQ
jgi:hypothetical protein